MLSCEVKSSAEPYLNRAETIADDQVPDLKPKDQQLETDNEIVASLGRGGLTSERRDKIAEIIQRQYRQEARQLGLREDAGIANVVIAREQAKRQRKVGLTGVQFVWPSLLASCCSTSP